MPTAELIGPNRMNIDGKVYLKNKPVPIDMETAFSLANNPRFKVSGLTSREVVEFQEMQRRPREPDLLRAINEAADMLDVDDEDNFDRSGRPSVAALSKALGYPITKEERDAALNAVEKAPQAGKTDVEEIKKAAKQKLVVKSNPQAEAEEPKVTV